MKQPVTEQQNNRATEQQSNRATEQNQSNWAVIAGIGSCCWKAIG
ncbi:hypothetical protein [Paenibacillus alvei]|nr:hypothetical protein [Paenibacillus alvei]